VVQAKQRFTAGYTTILAYFYISNQNYLTKQIMASKCGFMKSKNAFIVKLPNSAKFPFGCFVMQTLTNKTTI